MLRRSEGRSEDSIHSRRRDPPDSVFSTRLTPVKAVVIPLLRLQSDWNATTMPERDMDAPALERFRSLLLSMKREAIDAVEGRLHGHGEHRHDEAALPRHADETDDEAAAETQRQADVTHLNRSATALHDIESALARIDAGDYGLCVDCDEAIDPRRLQAHPAALRCAHCQGRFEAAKGRTGPRV